MEKIGRSIAHLRGTLDLVLTLSADKAWLFKWFVDAACGVHADVKGHSVGGLTLGKGFPIGISAKQKKMQKVPLKLNWLELMM